MSEAWLNLAVVGLAGFVLLIIYAFCKRRISDIPSVISKGILTGIAVGLVSDLLWGKFLGLWSYTLGYDLPQLSIIAAVVYGTFATTILLIQQEKFVHFFIWIAAITVVYETANHFFRVWTYDVPIPLAGLPIFLLVGYVLTAVFISGLWHSFGYRFRFISDLSR